MFHRTILKTVFDAFIIVLLGIFIGFSFNYARKDGLSVKKKLGDAEQQSAGNASKPVEPVWIELSEAKRYFEEGNALFIDAREKEEYIDGHIRASVNIPYSAYLKDHPDISSIVDRGKIIITYCSGSECEASIQLAYAMWEKGYSGIKIFFGGWQEWVNAGLPAEKGN